MPAAIDACRRGFIALAAGEVLAPARVHLVEGGRTTLLMSASSAVGRVAKVVSIYPANRERGVATTTGVVTVLDPETGHTIGLCDGGALTAIRTGAVAGLATDLLACPRARIGAVLGAGGQAFSQARALACVRELDELRVFARDRARLEAFVERVADVVGVPVVAARSAAAALEGADVVSAATCAVEPALRGAWLAPGAHVNGVGSFRLDMRELDQEAVARAARVVVDLRESALREAGELVAARDAGVTDAAAWVELGELLRDASLGRRGPDEITLFKSVGHAVQDLYAAQAAVAAAASLGLGRELDL